MVLSTSNLNPRKDLIAQCLFHYFIFMVYHYFFLASQNPPPLIICFFPIKVEKCNTHTQKDLPLALTHHHSVFLSIDSFPLSIVLENFWYLPTPLLHTYVGKKYVLMVFPLQNGEEVKKEGPYKIGKPSASTVLWLHYSILP